MPIVDSFLHELEQESRATRRVLEAVPGDKLEWKPADKSMTLGQLAMHVATIQGRITRALLEDAMTIPKFRQGEPASKNEILSALDESLKGAKEALSGMDDEMVLATWKVIGPDGTERMSMPRVAALRTLVCNHTYHHRGQLTVYLRLLGVPVPSVYGPTADQNPFA